MTNFVPHNQTLVLKGFRNQTTQLDIQNLGKRITPYLIDVKVDKDKYPSDPNFGLMAFFNYRSPEQAKQAKLTLSNEIRVLSLRGDTVDLSRVVVVERLDLTPQVFELVFTLWVGNIHNATEDDIRRAFSRFGAFVPATSGINQVAIGTFGEKRYAFVNFSVYGSADSALRSCNNGEITFGPAGSGPAEARPRGSVLLVQQILLALRNTPDNQLRFSDAETVVRETERTSRSRLDGWLDLLRRLPLHFVVDAAARIIRAARGQPALIQPGRGQGGRPAPTSLRPLPPTATPPLLTAAASAAGDTTSTAAAVGPPPPPPVPAIATGPLCVVCLDAPIGAALQPCFHAAYCGRCAGDVLERALPCPICRAAVEGVQRIFLP